MLEPTWADLLDIGPGDRVLVVHAPGSTATLDGVRRCTGDAGDVEVGQAADQSPPGPWDLVCVDGAHLDARSRAALRAELSPGGRWAEVADNPLAPLRLLDRVRGRRAGATSRRLAALRRSVCGGGLEAEQCFALLPSSVEPYTACDLMSRHGVATVVEMTTTHVGGARALLLRTAARDSRLLAATAPAWLLVARRPGEAPDEHDRVVGQVANRDSDEAKIVRGDPPHAVQRRGPTSPRPAEVRALTELADAGLAVVPRLLEVGAYGATYSWLTGTPLAVDTLSEDELVSWMGRASELLARLHDVTRRADGSVLIHGDYWLGNLLVGGDTITGLVDWGGARRGSPEVDRRFLVESLARARALDAAAVRRLEAARDVVLPGRARPDPAALVLGAHAGSVRLAESVVVRRLPDQDGADGAVDAVAAAGRETGLPVAVLPASAAATLALAQGLARLPTGTEALVPDADVVEALLQAGSRARLVGDLGLAVAAQTGEHRYLAYVDPDGEVVGECTTRTLSDGRRLEVARREDVVAVGRRVVDGLSLRGVVSVAVGDAEDGGLGVAAVDLHLDPQHALVADAGVDVAGLLYADLAGVARPRTYLVPQVLDLSSHR